MASFLVSDGDVDDGDDQGDEEKAGEGEEEVEEHEAGAELLAVGVDQLDRVVTVVPPTIHFLLGPGRGVWRENVITDVL